MIYKGLFSSVFYKYFIQLYNTSLLYKLPMEEKICLEKYRIYKNVSQPIKISSFGY